MEATSLRENNIFTLMDFFWWMMKNLFKSISLQSFKIKFTNFNNNLECNKVNNTMLNCVLVSQQVDIYNFTKDYADNLNESKNESDSCSIFYEKFCLLIRKFHDVDSFRYFRV